MKNRPVDLWLEPLDATDVEYRYYWSLLDWDEQSKALRFVQALHRRRYVISHGKLRVILSGYLGLAAEKIVYRQQKFGKPDIVIEGGEHAVKFNLAHSGEHMLVAVGSNLDIGVDIECWDRKVDCAAIVGICFAEAEFQFWQDLPDDGKGEFFYRLWTRKESFIKAVGVGLGLDVSRVVCSLMGATRFLSVPEEYGPVGGWRLFDLDFGNGISAALTVSAQGYQRLRFKRLAGGKPIVGGLDEVGEQLKRHLAEG